MVFSEIWWSFFGLFLTLISIWAPDFFVKLLGDINSPPKKGVAEDFFTILCSFIQGGLKNGWRGAWVPSGLSRAAELEMIGLLDYISVCRGCRCFFIRRAWCSSLILATSLMMSLTRRLGSDSLAALNERFALGLKPALVWLKLALDIWTLFLAIILCSGFAEKSLTQTKTQILSEIFFCICEFKDLHLNSQSK